MDGSVLPRFKRALIDNLTGYVDNAYYQSPQQPEDMHGADGSRVVCWWDDQADAEIDEPVFIGPAQRWFDENATVTLVIQALGVDTGDTQETCDQRATEVLGQVVALLATEPTAGTTDNADMTVFDATPTSWSYQGGNLGSNLRAASYRLTITVHNRVQLERT